jgi:hypothetical protein
MMRLRHLTIAALTLVALAVVPVAAQAKGQTAQSLFVLDAAQGSLEHRAGSGWTLRLARTSPLVTRFTDRPVRQADTTRLRTFVRQWKAYGFRADPPNAALVIAGAPRNRDVFVFTLRQPRISGRTVVFSVTPIGATTTGLAAFAGRADGLSALRRVGARADAPRRIRFASSSLFIDGGELAGIVYQPITFSFANVQPGQTVVVNLASEGPVIGFSTGPFNVTSGGLSLSSTSGPAPIAALRILPNAIIIETTNTGGGGTLAFSLSAYLAAQSDIEMFSLSSPSGGGIDVLAQVGNAVFQVVGPDRTIFAWNPE